MCAHWEWRQCVWRVLKCVHAWACVRCGVCVCVLIDVGVRCCQVRRCGGRVPCVPLYVRRVCVQPEAHAPGTGRRISIPDKALVVRLHLHFCGQGGSERLPLVPSQGEVAPAPLPCRHAPGRGTETHGSTGFSAFSVMLATSVTINYKLAHLFLSPTLSNLPVSVALEPKRK